MSIPTSFNPLGTLGAVTLFETLRLPTGTSVEPIVYETPFTGPVTGKVDIELLTYNKPPTSSGGMVFAVGKWNVEGSCFTNFRQHELDWANFFYMPLVFRSESNAQFRYPRPASGTMHTVVTVSQNGIAGHMNDTVIQDTSFSAIDGTGKDFNISVSGFILINTFDLHSVDFWDASKTLSFRPAAKNGVNGLYELHTKNFHPIPGSIVL